MNKYLIVFRDANGKQGNLVIRTKATKTGTVTSEVRDTLGPHATILRITAL